MDNIGDKKENNSFSVPSYFWGRQPSLLKGQPVISATALSRISAVKFRWHYKPCEFFTLNFTDSLLHFSYWDFFTCPHCSLFGQSTMVSSGCQARWPGLLFIPSSCNFCHWWTSLPHHSSVITSPASFILWLELPLSQWPVWFFPIWCLYSAFPRQKLENNSQNYLNK